MLQTMYVPHSTAHKLDYTNAVTFARRTSLGSQQRESLNQCLVDVITHLRCFLEDMALVSARRFVIHGYAHAFSC